jgi:GTP-binding protein EngB required for normal cell division
VTDNLPERVVALDHFISLTTPHLPPAALEPARRAVSQAGSRLALSRHHTVVALAGATGSGKSSLFNALAGSALSEVGLRRPTTGVAHASVWGSTDSAGPLLDWLGVGRRFGHPDAGALDGLVLLDLPDFDSVERAHRVEADRLLSLVDLMVWVLDPQKYADKVVHRQYLAQYSHHREITVVALNQADRLTPSQLAQCVDDLRRILAEDGLPGVPVVATSAVAAPGLDALRSLLEKAVAARTALLRRLAGDVEAAADGLAPVMAAPAIRPVSQEVAAHLHRALAAAAGVPLVMRATEKGYVHRAVKHTGWPVTRWVRRTRADPLSRLRLGRGSSPAAPAATSAGAPGSALGEPVGATSIGPAAPAASAAVGLAVRAVADHCAHGLPAPWPDAVLAAARSRQTDVPDALDVAVARTDLGLDRTPSWWRIVGAVQVALVVATAAGLLWLVARYLLFALALPEPPIPSWGRVPWPTLLLLGGLGGGLLLAGVTRPIVNALGRRRARRVGRALNKAVARVGDTLVLAPVEALRTSYAAAREALTNAST